MSELGSFHLMLFRQRAAGRSAVSLDATNQPKSVSYLAEYTPYTIAWTFPAALLNLNLHYRVRGPSMMKLCKILIRLRWRIERRGRERKLLKECHIISYHMIGVAYDEKQSSAGRLNEEYQYINEICRFLTMIY
jgi:hypothetical protein